MLTRNITCWVGILEVEIEILDADVGILNVDQ